METSAFDVPKGYPKATAEILYPELDAIQHSDEELKKAALYLIPGQERVAGLKLFLFLTGTDRLKSCLSYRDAKRFAEEPSLYPDEWERDVVFFWASAVKLEWGTVSVPALVWNGQKPVVIWDFVTHDWNSSDPAAILNPTSSA